MKDGIDWEELRRKVEDDFDKEYFEDRGCGNADCSICEGKKEKDCIGLPTKDGSDTYDFADEHGFVDDNGNIVETDDPDSEDIIYEEDTENDEEDTDIPSIAWRKNTPVVKNGDFLGLEEPNMFYPKEEFNYSKVLKDGLKAITNNLTKAKKIPQEIEILCRHFDNKSQGVDPVYIYPINDYQKICLCDTCNANLASKMLEQLALETFIARP
jgi:hypothetical protein